MTLLLRSLGHEVSGIALEPISDGLFEAATVQGLLENHLILDIRERFEMQNAVKQIAPDVVIHMAAQPLVLESFRAPVETFDTNVSGTLNVLLACKEALTLKALLVVTTDKVYKNLGDARPFTEESPLGGHDPYSASKAMADLLAQSFANLDCSFSIGIARAGNVIGMGDISQDRLIPDVVRALEAKTPLTVRNPDSVRPWQHVLDCLNGYLLFVEHLVRGPNVGRALALNFGPNPENYLSVANLVSSVEKSHPELSTRMIKGQQFGRQHETEFLTLDSSKAREELGWRDKLSISDAVAWSLEGHKVENIRQNVDAQIAKFLAM